MMQVYKPPYPPRKGQGTLNACKAAGGSAWGLRPASNTRLSRGRADQDVLLQLGWCSPHSTATPGLSWVERAAAEGCMPIFQSLPLGCTKGQCLPLQSPDLTFSRFQQPKRAHLMEGGERFLGAGRHFLESFWKPGDPS